MLTNKINLTLCFLSYMHVVPIHTHKKKKQPTYFIRDRVRLGVIHLKASSLTLSQGQCVFTAFLQ